MSIHAWYIAHSYRHTQTSRGIYHGDKRLTRFDIDGLNVSIFS